ncbi:hypothetical protein D3C78_608750 [compost metagenome]
MPVVNPAVLVWARESAGLTLAAAGKSLSLGGKRTAPEDALADIEQSGDVSVSLLNKMAAVYRRPLLSFYLPRPPETAPRGEDYRTLPEEIRIESAATIDALVRDIYVRQGLIKAALVEADETVKNGIIGSLPITIDQAGAVDCLKKIIEFDLSRYRSFRKIEASFGYLRKLVEDAGVYVLLIGDLGSHHTAIPAEAFRGFAIADPVAPFIVINDNDAVSARPFTLLHELVHLMLGQTGVSGGRAEQKIERFCNEVASKVLLLEDELPVGSFFDTPTVDLVKLVQAAAEGKAVSAALILYRIYSAGAVSEEQWKQASNELRRQWLEMKRSKKADSAGEGGPNYYVVKRYKLGGALVNTVGRMMGEGVLTATKAGRVLGVKPSNVYGLVGA